MGYLFTGLLCLLIGYYTGWGSAHHTVADECKKLGKFYVRKDIYVCTKVPKPSEVQEALIEDEK